MCGLEGCAELVEFCVASFEPGVVVVCGDGVGGAEGVVVARGGDVAGQAACEVEASSELVGRRGK